LTSEIKEVEHLIQPWRGIGSVHRIMKA